MDTACSPAVATDFDRALALLHNFWYARALEGFQRVSYEDPKCAIAYWGAAMTYNHPFWDPPSQADEMAAWTLVQKGISAKEVSGREKLYLAAVAALYKNAGAGSKATRDQNYRDAMATAYAQHPDDETALFYGLSILGAIPEGSMGICLSRRILRFLQMSFMGIFCWSSIGPQKHRRIFKRPCSGHQTVLRPSLGWHGQHKL